MKECQLPLIYNIFQLDRKYEQLASLENVTNGVAGYNPHAIHISLVAFSKI